MQAEPEPVTFVADELVEERRQAICGDARAGIRDVDLDKTSGAAKNSVLTALPKLTKPPALAPLISHGLSYAGVGHVSNGLSILGPWQVIMAQVGLITPARLTVNEASGYVVSRAEEGEVFEPEAGFLAGVVAELPRLDDLVRLADAAADDADRVLDGDAWYVRLHQTQKCECRWVRPLGSAAPH